MYNFHVIKNMNVLNTNKKKVIFRKKFYFKVFVVKNILFFKKLIKKIKYRYFKDVLKILQKVADVVEIYFINFIQFSIAL